MFDILKQRSRFLGKNGIKRAEVMDQHPFLRRNENMIITEFLSKPFTRRVPARSEMNMYLA
jgi:hypothetical protein